MEKSDFDDIFKNIITEDLDSDRREMEKNVLDNITYDDIPEIEDKEERGTGEESALIGIVDNGHNIKLGSWHRREALQKRDIKHGKAGSPYAHFIIRILKDLIDDPNNKSKGMMNSSEDSIKEGYDSLKLILKYLTTAYHNSKVSVYNHIDYDPNFPMNFIKNDLMAGEYDILYVGDVTSQIEEEPEQGFGGLIDELTGKKTYTDAGSIQNFSALKSLVAGVTSENIESLNNGDFSGLKPIGRFDKKPANSIFTDDQFSKLRSTEEEEAYNLKEVAAILEDAVYNNWVKSLDESGEADEERIWSGQYSWETVPDKKDDNQQNTHLKKVFMSNTPGIEIGETGKINPRSISEHAAIKAAVIAGASGYGKITQHDQLIDLVKDFNENGIFDVKSVENIIKDGIYKNLSDICGEDIIKKYFKSISLESKNSTDDKTARLNILVMDLLDILDSAAYGRKLDDQEKQEIISSISPEEINRTKAVNDLEKSITDKPGKEPKLLNTMLFFKRLVGAGLSSSLGSQTKYIDKVVGIEKKKRSMAKPDLGEEEQKEKDEDDLKKLEKNEKLVSEYIPEAIVKANPSILVIPSGGFTVDNNVFIPIKENVNIGSPFGNISSFDVYYNKSVNASEYYGEGAKKLDDIKQAEIENYNDAKAEKEKFKRIGNTGRLSITGDVKMWYDKLHDAISLTDYTHGDIPKHLISRKERESKEGEEVEEPNKDSFGNISQYFKGI